MYDELTDCTSLVYKKLQALTDRAEALKAEAARIQEVNRMLVYRIQEGKLTDISDIDCAISWLDHSDLPAGKIIDKI